MKKDVLTDSMLKRLFQIPLFHDMREELKASIAERLDFTAYRIDKKEEIIRQGSPCRHLYVLIKGTLQVDIIDGNGNSVMVEHIEAPRTFATPHLFNRQDNRFPATFTALTDCVLLTATRDATFRLISEEPDLLRNFLCVTGNCNACTVSRLNVLSYKTVRGRFIAYVMSLKKADSLSVRIRHNYSQLAEYLNVTRPALSKEIHKLEEEGIIRIDGPQIELLQTVTAEGRR